MQMHPEYLISQSEYLFFFSNLFDCFDSFQQALSSYSKNRFPDLLFISWNIIFFCVGSH